MIFGFFASIGTSVNLLQFKAFSFAALLFLLLFPKTGVSEEGLVERNSKLESRIREMELKLSRIEEQARQQAALLQELSGLIKAQRKEIYSDLEQVVKFENVRKDGFKTYFDEANRKIWQGVDGGIKRYADVAIPTGHQNESGWGMWLIMPKQLKDKIQRVKQE